MKFDISLVQTVVQSPLGAITLAASSKGLAGLWFEGQRHGPEALAGNGAAHWRTDARHPVLQTASQQLSEYFAGRRMQFDVPLDLSSGTAFQQAVWQALLAIRAGDTASYSDISQRIGKPTAVRAVGAAIGRNPVSIVVPCHRVIGRNGSLTGYAGGLVRKTALLNREGAFEETMF